MRVTGATGRHREDDFDSLTAHHHHNHIVQAMLQYVHALYAPMVLGRDHHKCK